MQTFETSHFNNIVLETPMLRLERQHVVDVFEQSCDGVGLGGVGVWYVPQNIRGRQAIALHCQSETHVGRVDSRNVARCRQLLPQVNFWEA